jgi:hypothetical protein
MRQMDRVTVPMTNFIAEGTKRTTTHLSLAINVELCGRVEHQDNNVCAIYIGNDMVGELL